MMIESWYKVSVVAQSTAIGHTYPRTGCRINKPSAFSSSDALGILGGTKTHRGITVKYTVPETTDLKSGARYLVLAWRCVDGTIRLVIGPAGVFEVAPDGQNLLPNRSRVRSNVATLFDKIRSVESIFRAVDAIRKDSAQR